MRTIKFKVETDPTKDADKLCEQIEAELGIKLKLNDPKNPNEVHGFLTTTSDGEIEINLYEDSDAKAVNKAIKKTLAKKHGLTDEAIERGMQALYKLLLSK